MKFLKGLLQKYGIVSVPVEEVPIVEHRSDVMAVYTVTVQRSGAQQWNNNDGSHMFIKDPQGNEVLRMGVI